MKHVVLRISSFFCFSLRRSAKVSMITPKMRFSTMMMTMKKNRRSYTTRAGKRDSCTVGHREDGFQQGRWLCSQAPREKYVGA